MHILTSKRFWFGVIISVTCLWLAFHNIPFEEFLQKLREADLVYVAMAIGFQLLAILARGFRWREILGRGVTIKTATYGHGIGFLFNNILPFRVGEMARTIAVSENSGQPLLRVASTVVVERLVDVAVIFLGLVTVLPFMKVSPEVLQGGVFLGVFALLGLLILFLAAAFPSRGKRILSSIFGRIPSISTDRWLGWFDQIIKGLESLTSFAAAGRVLFWSIVSWVCSILLYWLVFKAFQPAANILEATFVVVAISLSISIPSSPGFLGIFQYIGQQALVIPFSNKYDPTIALAAIMVSYLVYYLGTSLFGILALVKTGQSFVQFVGRIYQKPNAH